MRFLAFGGWYGSGNVGDDAILVGVKSVLQEVSSGGKVTALSIDPERTRDICGVEAEWLLSPKEYLLRGANYDAFSQADVILVTGGTPLYDYDHFSRLIHMRLARREVPLACFGVGAKRIDSPYGRWLTRRLLLNARISVRDKVSKMRIEGIIGGPVNLTGDSALFVEPAPRGTVQALLEKMGVERSGKIAVICPRALSASNRAHYHDHITQLQIESIRMGLARAADKLSEAGYTVVFLPMHIASTDDDLAEIRSIRGSMIMPSHFLTKTLEPHTAAAFLGSASIVVGLRLHSLILAASQGVPVVSVGYDEKIRGFMDYAGIGGCVVEPVELANKSLVVAARGEKSGVVLSGSCSVMKARIREEASALVESLG